MKHLSKFIRIGLLATLITAPAFGAKWAIDGAHSNLNFSIRHLGIANVTGSFGSFNGTINFDPEMPEKAMTEATIQVSSINTNNADRDNHLNQPDYFNTSEFPVATFKSTKWKKAGDMMYTVTGNLTLMGVTKEVVLDVEFYGAQEMTMRGRTVTKAGFSATTEIDRYAFGLGGEGNAPLGRKVKLTINIEADKQ